MTTQAKLEVLIARDEIVAAPGAHTSGKQEFMRLLPFMVFCFGMPLAAIPMMLG
ncbi:MAG TPA: hypothetical protein VFK28_00165 [Sphingomicrobium sp.]|jgi:hypothetical protein|nr:hypothetical protein [Sphingomicrobium sp.]